MSFMKNGYVGYIELTDVNDLKDNMTFHMAAAKSC